MIKIENGGITLQGKASILLLEMTLIVKTLKLQLAEKGVPEEVADRLLSDAYMFAILKPEDFLKLMMTHNPGEDIKWEEILN